MDRLCRAVTFLFSQHLRQKDVFLRRAEDRVVGALRCDVSTLQAWYERGPLPRLHHRRPLRRNRRGVVREPRGEVSHAVRDHGRVYTSKGEKMSSDAPRPSIPQVNGV